MAPEVAFVVLLAVVLLPAASPAAAPAPAPAATFGITKILSGYPEFSVFSSLLNDTGLARVINGRKVVTVLAVNNTDVSGAVRRLPRALLADLLALHVVLDYLDPEKLDALRHGRTGNGSVVTTLLQLGTGAGLLRVAGGDDGRITFSPAAVAGNGSGQQNASLVRVVTAQAYNVLILQVSGLVLPAAVPATTAAPFDITKILSGYSEFSLFSSLLKETGLARAINGRKVVTVLAVNNTAVSGAVRRLPRAFLADLLALHIVLDYLDPEKLDALRRGRTGNGSVVTTLLQPGTNAGLLRVAGGDDGRITFSSVAAPGSGMGQRNASLVRVVTAQAYSVLVLQVSGLVLPAAVPATAAAPFDITKILSAYPEFSVFSSMLTETDLARAINGQQVVTVLTPNNTAVSDALRGMPRLPRQLLADLLALHAVLDYLDPEKLDALRRGRTGRGAILTTLLQGTGAALGRGTGFIRISGGEDGRITFSSAVPGGGGSRNATLVRVVTAQAYNVLVLQVSGLVLPPSIITSQPPRARHMSLPPSPAPGPQYPPVSGPGPLVPSPIMPVPTPNLVDTPPPPSGVIPIPSVHGGVAAKLPSAAGHRAASWWSGAGVAFGIMASLLVRLQ